MAKNYAYESGAFMAMARLFSEAVQELNAAQDTYDRDWARKRLNMLAEQTNEMMAELGYKEKI